MLRFCTTDPAGSSCARTSVRWSVRFGYRCHVVVREGFASLNELEETEEDLLDRAWGLEPNSRLSCQAIIANTDLVVEIPK